MAKTQASRPKLAKPPAPPKPALPKKQHSKRWLWALVFACLLAASITIGALAGFQSGRQMQSEIQTELVELSLDDQYNLALQDINEGRLEIARQRLEYIVAQDPGYPGITEKLAEVMAVLYATATPTPVPATITPTPTRDPRPIEELFNQAQALVAAGDYDKAIDTLVALRKADTSYKTARVDGLMFITLRNRGVDKIWAQGNLVGGTYDLALASNFGPLDAQAASARQLANLYMIGSSFWEVHPEQAVYYFGQVAAAAPGLSDASGWTARERYRVSLVQFGDLLASKNDWCGAQEQYQLALSIQPDEGLQAKVEEAILKCSPPSETPLIETPTTTPSSPATIPPVSETPTFPVPPSPTNTQAVPPSPTDTQPAPPPSETPTPTTETQPSETPTETLAPPASDVTTTPANPLLAQLEPAAQKSSSEVLFSFWRTLTSWMGGWL